MSAVRPSAQSNSNRFQSLETLLVTHESASRLALGVERRRLRKSYFVSRGKNRREGTVDDTEMDTKRDYVKEYRAYYGPRAEDKGTPNRLQRLHRKHKTSRQRARTVIMKAMGLKKLPRGMDVDHVNKNPLDNRVSNLRLMTVRRNRGKCAKTKC